MWLPTALAAASISGFVSILDSHLIGKRLSSLSAFLLPTAVVQGLCGVVILMTTVIPVETNGMTVLLTIISSAVRAVGIFIILRALRAEEVSRVMPVTSSFPIFVALLAVPFMNEVLGWLQWLAIVITVAGVMLISIQRHPGGIRLRKSFASLVFASLLLGISNTLAKYVLDGIPLLPMYGINTLTVSASFILFSLPGSLRGELRGLAADYKSLLLVTINALIAMVGFYFYFGAIEKGPVSQVSTILSTRPVFIFIFALIVSRVYPAVLNERMGRSAVVIKMVSIALIIGGVALLLLNGQALPVTPLPGGVAPSVMH